MARHETFTLDTETAAHAATIRQTLMVAVSEGIPVSFTVIGRDSHIMTDRMGTVVGFSGAMGMSSECVTVDTDKGPRSFNVWLIRSAEIVGA